MNSEFRYKGQLVKSSLVGRQEPYIVIFCHVVIVRYCAHTYRSRYYYSSIRLPHPFLSSVGFPSVVVGDRSTFILFVQKLFICIRYILCITFDIWKIFLSRSVYLSFFQSFLWVLFPSLFHSYIGRKYKFIFYY